MELPGPLPQRGHPGAPHGHAAEQHLRRRQLLLHRLLRGEQDPHPLRHRPDTGEAGRQEDLEGHQRAGAGTDARPGAGKRPVVPTRLPQRHRAGEDDLPERQGADHRDERETDFRAHHRLAHRL